MATALRKFGAIVEEGAASLASPPPPRFACRPVSPETRPAHPYPRPRHHAASKRHLDADTVHRLKHSEARHLRRHARRDAAQLPADRQAADHEGRRRRKGDPEQCAGHSPRRVQRRDRQHHDHVLHRVTGAEEHDGIESQRDLECERGGRITHERHHDNQRRDGRYAIGRHAYQHQGGHSQEGHCSHSPTDGACLLYTSDASDQRSRVDLGGRRIITKKHTHIQRVRAKETH